MTGTVDAKGLANLFLDWSAEARISLSPMKLQKLVFFTHADYLVRTGKPLVSQGFEAWDYGPVIPSLYREFKHFKDKPVSSRATTFDPVTTKTLVSICQLPEQTAKLVRQMFDFYSRLDAIHLSELSHEFEGVWRHARSLFANGLNMDRRISNEMIIRHHKPIHS
jgi:uncharacterized phage-associated protein